MNLVDWYIGRRVRAFWSPSKNEWHIYNADGTGPLVNVYRFELHTIVQGSPVAVFSGFRYSPHNFYGYVPAHQTLDLENSVQVVVNPHFPSKLSFKDETGYCTPFSPCRRMRFIGPRMWADHRHPDEVLSHYGSNVSK